MRWPTLKSFPSPLRPTLPLQDWRFRTVWWAVIALCVLFWAWVIVRIVTLF